LSTDIHIIGTSSNSVFELRLNTLSNQIDVCAARDEMIRFKDDLFYLIYKS